MTDQQNNKACVFVNLCGLEVSDSDLIERKERLNHILFGLKRESIPYQSVPLDSTTDKYTTEVFEALKIVHGPSSSWLPEKINGGDDFPPTWREMTMDVKSALTAVCVAVNYVVENSHTNSAVALVRPPGHHARPNEGSGFCYRNNALVAAACLNRIQKNANPSLNRKSSEPVHKILIIDFDLHFGGGTAEILAENKAELGNVHLLSFQRMAGQVFDDAGTLIWNNQPEFDTLTQHIYCSVCRASNSYKPFNHSGRHAQAKKPHREPCPQTIGYDERPLMNRQTSWKKKRYFQEVLTDASVYLAEIDTMVAEVQPLYAIVVSAGFDRYTNDFLPAGATGQWSKQIFEQLAQKIESLALTHTVLKKTVTVLEGGYKPQTLRQLPALYIKTMQATRHRLLTQQDSKKKNKKKNRHTHTHTHRKKAHGKAQKKSQLAKVSIKE